MVVRALVGCVVLLLSACGSSTTLPTADREDGWQRLADAPLSGRTGAVLASLGDRVVVFGGWPALCPPNADCAAPEGEDAVLTDGAVLDLDTGRWEPIADSPYGVRHTQPVVMGTDVYLLTGCRDRSYCDGPQELLHYDAAADVWAELAPLPEDSGYPRLHAWSGDLLAMSTTDEHREADNFRYDMTTRRWSRLPDDGLPPSFDRFAVGLGTELLVFGSPIAGLDEEVSTTVGAVLEDGAKTWQRLPDGPNGYQAWPAAGRVFLNPHYGDSGGGIFEPVTRTWQAFPTGPDDAKWRHDMAGLLSDDAAIYEYDAGWVLDAQDQSWVEVPERPGTAYDESLTALGRDLFVFGGQDWADTMGAGEGALLAQAWLWTAP